MVSSSVNIEILRCVISSVAGMRLDVIITTMKTVKCSVSIHVPPGMQKVFRSLRSQNCTPTILTVAPPCLLYCAGAQPRFQSWASNSLVYDITTVLQKNRQDCPLWCSRLHNHTLFIKKLCKKVRGVRPNFAKVRTPRPPVVTPMVLCTHSYYKIIYSTMDIENLPVHYTRC